jgi:hypothetical protein
MTNTTNYLIKTASMFYHVAARGNVINAVESSLHGELNLR